MQYVAAEIYEQMKVNGDGESMRCVESFEIKLVPRQMSSLSPSASLLYEDINQPTDRPEILFIT